MFHHLFGIQHNNLSFLTYISYPYLRQPLNLLKGRIKSVLFLFHHLLAIATSSMATELIKGKSIEDALKLTNSAVVEALEGLPPVKIHCSVLAEQAVKAALQVHPHDIAALGVADLAHTVCVGHLPHVPGIGGPQPCSAGPGAEA